MDYDDLFSTKDAQEYLNVTEAHWLYIVQRLGLIEPIPMWERTVDGKTNHMAHLFSKRQLDELAKNMAAVDKLTDITAVVKPIESELNCVYSVAEAAEYMGKKPSALRMQLHRRKKAGKPMGKKIGDQIVLLREDVEALADPSGLKAALAAHGMKEE